MSRARRGQRRSPLTDTTPARASPRRSNAEGNYHRRPAPEHLSVQATGGEAETVVSRSARPWSMISCRPRLTGGTEQIVVTGTRGRTEVAHRDDHDQCQPAADREPAAERPQLPQLRRARAGRERLADRARAASRPVRQLRQHQRLHRRPEPQEPDQPWRRRRPELLEGQSLPAARGAGVQGRHPELQGRI
jgi:hypothetical protein